MRNREAWLAAIATALGISEEACRRDAAPQVQQVATAASSSAPVVAVTAPSASADTAPSASEVASAAPSASASVASLVRPAPSMTPQQQLLQAICGASVQNQLQNMPSNGICGVSVNPNQIGQLPGNGSCGATANPGNRIPGSGACGGIGAPLQSTVRGPTAVVAVSLTAGAPGDDHVAASLRPRFRACANQALAQDPSQQGKLVIVATVAPNGDVASAGVSNNSGLSASSAACMVRIVKNAQFPAGTAARTIVVTVNQTKQSP